MAKKAPEERRDGKIRKEIHGKNFLYKRQELLIDHLTLLTAYCTRIESGHDGKLQMH